MLSSPTHLVGVACAALACVAIAGCGSSGGLSASQHASLRAQIASATGGINSANTSLNKCKQKPAGSQALANCVGSSMDDVSGHVGSVSAFVAGLAASASGTCQAQLNALSKAMATESTKFKQAGVQARGLHAESFKATLRSIQRDASATIGKRAEDACA